MGRVSSAVRAVILVLSALTLLSAAAGVAFAVSNDPPAWFVLGFETLVALAAVCGGLLGLGKFRQGPSIGLLCVAGAMGVCSLLAYQAAPRLPGLQLAPWLIGRGVVAGLLVILAAWITVAQNPRVALPDLLKGGLLAGVFLASAAGLALVRGQIVLLDGWLQFVVWLVASVWLIALFAPALHLLIRAFNRAISVPNAPSPG